MPTKKQETQKPGKIDELLSAYELNEMKENAARLYNREAVLRILSENHKILSELKSSNEAVAI